MFGYCTKLANQIEKNKKNVNINDNGMRGRIERKNIIDDEVVD